MLRLLVCLLAVATAHITFTDASQPVGVSIPAELHVGHATTGTYTYSVTVTMPQGVQRASVVVKDGWNSTVTRRSLPPALQYEGGHGTVTTVVDTITWEAVGPINPDLNEGAADLFHFDVTFGCSLSDAASNTLWNNYYTAWFPTVQRYKALADNAPAGETLWTGVASGNAVWALLQPNPSPFMQFDDWTGCPTFQWFGATVTPLSPTALAILGSEQRTQATLQAGLNSVFARAAEHANGNLKIALSATSAAEQRVAALEASASLAYNIAVAAIVFAFVALLVAGVAVVLALRNKGGAYAKQVDVPK